MSETEKQQDKKAPQLKKVIQVIFQEAAFIPGWGPGYSSLTLKDYQGDRPSTAPEGLSMEVVQFGLQISGTVSGMFARIVVPFANIKAMRFE